SGRGLPACRRRRPLPPAGRRPGPPGLRFRPARPPVPGRGRAGGPVAGGAGRPRAPAHRGQLRPRRHLLRPLHRDGDPPAPRGRPGPVQPPAPRRAGDRGDPAGRLLRARGPLPARPLRGGRLPVLRRRRRPRRPVRHLRPHPRPRGAGRAPLPAPRPRARPLAAADARGWLAAGLRPRAITRDLDWGVPVPLPGWDDRRLYVWFDAVIGYLSASVEWAELHGDPDAWRCWWQGSAARHRYFVGKDNIWFHTVWWPAILLGADQGLRPPDEGVTNHHLTLSAGKLSASRGQAPTIDEGIDRVGLDPLRHALCA